MLIHTRRKAFAQGAISLTRHRIDLIRRLVLHIGGTYLRLDHFPAAVLYIRSKDIRLISARSVTSRERKHYEQGSRFSNPLYDLHKGQRTQKIDEVLENS